MERNEDQQKREQIRQYEVMKRMILRQGMSPDARERIGRVKLANPELAEKAEAISIQLIQQGKKIDDATIVEILKRLTPKRETSIRRI